jgi:hypothetical protein
MATGHTRHDVWALAPVAQTPSKRQSPHPRSSAITMLAPKIILDPPERLAVQLERSERIVLGAGSKLFRRICLADQVPLTLVAT